jgi:hypothetical protein
VVVQPSDGTYEIQAESNGDTASFMQGWPRRSITSGSNRPIIRNMKYLNRDFEDALGHGKKITVTSSQLPNFPDLAYTIQIYDGRAFGVIEVEVRNHTGNPVTIQSIRSVEAVGDKIVDLGGAPIADRVLSDSFSEDWPPLQIYI